MARILIDKLTYPDEFTQEDKKQLNKIAMEQGGKKYRNRENSYSEYEEEFLKCLMNHPEIRQSQYKYFFAANPLCQNRTAKALYLKISRSIMQTKGQTSTAASVSNNSNPAKPQQIVAEMQNNNKIEYPAEFSAEEIDYLNGIATDSNNTDAETYLKRSKDSNYRKEYKTEYKYSKYEREFLNCLMKYPKIQPKDYGTIFAANPLCKNRSSMALRVQKCIMQNNKYKAESKSAESISYNVNLSQKNIQKQDVNALEYPSVFSAEEIEYLNGIAANRNNTVNTIKYDETNNREVVYDYSKYEKEFLKCMMKYPELRLKDYEASFANNPLCKNRNASGLKQKLYKLKRNKLKVEAIVNQAVDHGIVAVQGHDIAASKSAVDIATAADEIHQASSKDTTDIQEADTKICCEAIRVAELAANLAAAAARLAMMKVSLGI